MFTARYGLAICKRRSSPLPLRTASSCHARFFLICDCLLTFVRYCTIIGVDLLLSFAHLILRMAFSRAASHWSNSQTFPGLDQFSPTIISCVFPLCDSEFEINVGSLHNSLLGAEGDLRKEPLYRHSRKLVFMF